MTNIASIAEEVSTKYLAGKTSYVPSVRVGEVIESAQAGFASGKRDDHGVIQLRMNNVDTQGRLVWTEFIRVPADAATIREYCLVRGDVVFNNTNSTALVGKSALFTEYEEPVVYSNHFTRLRVRRAQLSPSYLALWLNYEWTRGTFARICNQWIGQSAVKSDKLLSLSIPLPPLAEQERTAAELTAVLAAVDAARRAAQERLAATEALSFAYIRESLNTRGVKTMSLGECLEQVRQGVGASWNDYPVIGATRSGLAPAKESVGKYPERYKLVDCGGVFYNPMRILLGSIAMVDEDDAPGITSPDYVVVRGRAGVMDSRWFYRWFRSTYGEQLILSLSRGAVRERILFNRLAEGEIDLPPYEAQVEASHRILALNRTVPALQQEQEFIDSLPAALLRRAFNNN